MFEVKVKAKSKARHL